MKRLVTIITILLCSNTWLQAQNVRFTTEGQIEFEKSTNMYAILKKRLNKDNEGYMQQFVDNYKKTQPQFKLLKSTLNFGRNTSLFTPIEPEDKNNNFFGDPSAEQNNTIFTDLNTGISTAQKKIYEETFLVKDSVRKINWKITSETREIAGYDCRRANAVIMDSIYVVAFYTDKIPVSGGPESFGGLPGMILGVALPHENITWFAKSVKDRPVTDQELKAPAKGKPVDNKGLMAKINAALKDWGEYAQIALKAFTL